MKVKALITLIVGKQKEVPPGKIYDLSDNEAKRLITLGFAEPANSYQSGEKGLEDGSSSGKSG